ncbi:flavin reductase family protein [Catalinimonas niigatensis]|uniref:flavin reductase family protein n=1 Tax=Catalinimonas niigatensis TaxID=1397264 RepID=UPI002664F54C|nr:iron-sulfur cluster-binding domain-containing protein [Catalinimonas niigatensis]WPP51866.1 iron-sulfur cluster-binding domain-containing protein [Catalinimonas niigatensis]
MEYKVKIHSVVYETEDAITIRFEECPAFEGYTSGQFINIFKEHRGKMISRSYSFSSSPEVDELPAVTIKKVAGGLLSGNLIDTVRKGDELSVSQAAGRFGLQSNGLDSKHLIMIAGGSGITPLYSIIKTALIKSKEVRISLIYANKNISSVIFQNQLNKLLNQYGERFTIINFLEENTSPAQPNVYTGYISKDIIKQIINSDEALIPEVYVCGPEAIMKSVFTYLKELNVSNDRILSESYSSSVLKDNTTAVSSPKQAEVTFLKDNQSYKLRLSQDEYILQAALQEGLPLPYSCQEAMCGSCKVKVLSGKVAMSENYALTDSQLKEGYVLLCSGKATTEQLILSYR